MKLVYWPLIGGTARRGLGGLQPRPWPLLALPAVAAHPSTASVPITVLTYNGALLSGFTVSVDGLKQ